MNRLENMTQEDRRELLLKDLCARLPYGVKIYINDTDVDIEKVGVLSMVDNDAVIAFTCDDSNTYNYVTIHEVKPYLFPLSSMTKEQLFDVQEILGKNEIEIEDGFLRILDSDRNTISYLEILALLEWFYKNHFDINGLIERGLAIDATNLNIY